MGKIFCIMGKSGSGKDTIFKRLKEDYSLKLSVVVPYTTRPKRINETNGVEYYFIDDNQLNHYKAINKVIECREYDTIHGKWCYSTIDDGNIDLTKNNYLLITTLEAYTNLKNYFGEKNIVPIYIEVEDGLRLERALRRERRQRSPKYEELCRRFLADSIDFSSGKLSECNIRKVYANENLKDCINNIKKDILRQL